MYGIDNISNRAYCICFQTTAKLVPNWLTMASQWSRINVMTSLEDLTKRIVAFRDARDWKQFHNPKDMAISLLLEASEVIEHFQWKSPKEIEEYLFSSRNELADELADVLYWVLLMSHDLNIDITKSFDEKMLKNESKYSVDKAKGNHKKYTEL